MLCGQALLQMGHIAEAFREFNYAFGQICAIVKQQALLFLPYLFYMKMLLPENMTQSLEVQSRLLGFISQMVGSCSSHSCFQFNPCLL